MNDKAGGNEEIVRELAERIELALIVEKDDSFMEFKPSHIQIILDLLNQKTAECERLARETQEWAGRDLLIEAKLEKAVEALKGLLDCNLENNLIGGYQFQIEQAQTVLKELQQ